MSFTSLILRSLSFLTAFLLMLSVFGLIVWRGSVIWGFSLKIKTIVFLSIGLLGILAAGLSMSMTPWKSTQILGMLLVWGIYLLWVISPLLALRDMISYWYKVPPMIMTILSIVWIGIGIYFGTQTKVTELTLSSNRLTKDHSIVFISDIHVEAIHHRSYVQSIVNQIQTIKPDFVLLGGDLMNTANAEYVSAFEPFNQLSMPVYATLGNHDHMGDSTGMLQIFEKTSLLALRNQSVNLDDLQIVGIDDRSYRGKKNLTGILEESAIADSGQFTILVSHQPQKLSKLAKFPIDLELAGHTHNGQFWPMNWIIKFFNDYAYGKYVEDGKTAFVSQGIGTWGAPIRIGTQSELVHIMLKKSSQ